MDCPVVGAWTVPFLDGWFTRCDIAQMANVGMNVGMFVAGYVVFVLTAILVRGR
jgi:ABC-type taurine transport system substrate-binding protein